MSKRVIQAASRLLQTRTSQRSALVFGANAAAAFLGLIGFVIVSRTLGPELFGLVTIATATTYVLAGLTDFGIGAALTSLATPIRKANPQRVSALFRAAFKIELAIGVLILLSALVLPPLLADALGAKTDTALLTDALRIAFVTGAAISVAAYVGAVFQTQERFKAMAAYIIGSSAVKLGIVLTLFATDSLSVTNALIAYSAAAIVSLFVGLRLVPTGRAVGKSAERKIRGEFYSFGKWLLVSFVISSLTSRLDIYFLAGNHGTAEVGVYGAALQLSLLFPILANSISTVLLPKFAQAPDRAELERFIKMAYRGLSLIALGAIPLVLIAPFAIDLIFGDAYAGSSAIFQVLVISLVMSIYSSPLQRVFFVLRKTNVVAGLNALNVIVSVGLYLLLIPAYGGIGAAWARVVATTLVLLIVASTVRIFVGRLKPNVPITKQVG